MPLFARLYDSTRKGTLLDSVPPGVTASTEPVVVIKDAEATVNQPRGAVCAPAPSRDR